MNTTLAFFRVVIACAGVLVAGLSKADFDGRVRKIKSYLKFNPDEIVLGLADAAILRLHGGQVVRDDGRKGGMQIAARSH